MKSLKRILAYLNPHKGLCALAVLCSLIHVAGELLIPILIGRAINVIENTVPTLDWSALGNLLIGIGVSVAFAALFGYILTLLTGEIGYRVAAAIRKDCMSRILSCELSYIDTLPHGDIIARIGVDTDLISDGLLQGITQLLKGVTTILGTIVLMLLVDVATALVVIALTPLSLIVSAVIARYSHKIFSKQAALRGEMGGIVGESFQNQKLLKAYGYEDETQARFEKVNRELDVVGTKAQFAVAIVNPSTRLVNGLVYAAVAIFGALSILNGNSALDIGGLTTFLIYANQYTRPFNDITSVASELQSAVAGGARVFELTDMKQEIETADTDLTDVSGAVTLQNVSFGYSPDRTLITDLNLNIRPGMRVAIVGPTGCGKSTLINLLMRFYDVTEGKICVDDTNIRDVTRKSLRTSYGMVLQETWLAGATVAQNIAYGKPDATLDEIMDAAKAAHCHQFVMQLPNGYDTLLEDGGDNMSVGQKQLLCIARVMLLSPPMLILDEATSNIDTRTERRIQSAFAKLTADKTSFVVAHRFATIVDADLILVMKDGNIVEQGKHKDLILQNGFYASLFRAQFE